MTGPSGDALVALVLTMHRAVPVYLLPLIALLSVAATALLARGRRPLEWVGLLVLIFLFFCGLVLLTFHGILDRPILRIERFTFP